VAEAPRGRFCGGAGGLDTPLCGTRLGISDVNAAGRAAAGIFTAQFLFGLVWAYLGRRIARRVP
jgi:hypothetical protein